MTTYLLKTEPSTYSFSDLVKQGSCTWDGVSNPQALNHLRAMRSGDECYIYHTGDEKAIVGLARVTGNAGEDPKQPGLNDRGEPKFAVVPLTPVRAAANPVTLATIKADARFKDFALVTHSRLSVMPVPAKLDALLRAMTGVDSGPTKKKAGKS